MKHADDATLDAIEPVVLHLGRSMVSAKGSEGFFPEISGVSAFSRRPWRNVC